LNGLVAQSSENQPLAHFLAFDAKALETWGRSKFVHHDEEDA
jgi:hypothetical protein